MRIDGREIAKSILEDLRERVAKLKDKGITPHLVIILAGHDPASEAYVRQKKLKGEGIESLVTVLHYKSSITNEQLLATIQQYNNDNNVHGLIVQRPLPPHIDSAAIDLVVDPKKDVDGFHPNTTFEMPLALAVMKILEHIYYSKNKSDNNFTQWLCSKKIVVIGKGPTGGRPTTVALRKLGIEPVIVDSKTKKPKKLTNAADIVISAIGKSNVVQKDTIKKGAILIGIGLHKESDGKLHGDYEEEDVKTIASCYTPTPGGVGPVNVAMLFANLVSAAETLPIDKRSYHC